MLQNIFANHVNFVIHDNSGLHLTCNCGQAIGSGHHLIEHGHATDNPPRSFRPSIDAIAAKGPSHRHRLQKRCQWVSASSMSQSHHRSNVLDKTRVQARPPPGRSRQGPVVGQFDCGRLPGWKTDGMRAQDTGELWYTTGLHCRAGKFYDVLSDIDTPAASLRHPTFDLIAASIYGFTGWDADKVVRTANEVLESQSRDIAPAYAAPGPSAAAKLKWLGRRTDADFAPPSGAIWDRTS